MAKDNFKTGLSTISGGSVVNILKIFNENSIESGYRLRALNSILFSLISQPFRWWEHLRYDKIIENYRIEKPPVFILGHWRSGTTHLHNILCKDPKMSFVTTYQGVFPEFHLGSSWLFKTFMKLMMPKKRASDNVELGADFPQEEEFALGNMNPYGFYNFWYFPSKTQLYYQYYIEFEGVSSSVKQRWKNDYIRLAKKSLISTGGKRFISKNPPHTGRIKTLLEMFPDARFIHIYRNPVTIFISTKKLIQTTMSTLQFEDISESVIEENIFWIYEKIMKAYLQDKELIPAGNLIEIRFEDFEKNTLTELERIYSEIALPDFERLQPIFRDYINAQKSYEKNQYKITRSLVDKITTRWNFAMEAWNYSLPDNLEIIDG